MTGTRLARFASLAVLAACAAPPPPVTPLPALAVPPAASASAVDERDPKTWVARLDERAQRARAVERLAELFEMAKESPPPARQKLVDAIVEPLAATYVQVSGELDEPTRKKLIQLLVDLEDRRAAPVYERLFASFPNTPSDDLASAAKGTARIAASGAPLEPALVSALWDCFTAFRPSQTKSISLVKELQQAVLAVKDASYGPKAIALLELPLKTPRDANEAMDKLMFWQLTAVRVIEALRFVPAVRPLVTALMTPAKSDLQLPIRRALSRMPRESEPVLVAALDGTDPSFAALAAQSPDRSSAMRLADVLGASSRPAGRDAIVRALENETNDANRAVLALALSQFPGDTKSVKAFQRAYARISPAVAVPALGGANAHALLVQAAAAFFDPSLTDWLLKEKAAAKGEAGDEMRAAALPAAIRLMTPSQSKAVGEAVQKLQGLSVEKDIYTHAAATLAKCKQDPICYASVFDTPVVGAPQTAKMTHVKAAWMAGVFGDAATRDMLVAKLAVVKDSSVRVAMLMAILHLSPRGDEASATRLEALAADDSNAGLKEELIRAALTLRARTL